MYNLDYETGPDLSRSSVYF